MKEPIINTEYLQSVFNLERFNTTVNVAAKCLDEWDQVRPFDSIAFTGVSGAALAFPLSVALDKHLICVRKKVSAHSYHKVEGNYGSESYVIVDDFIHSGNTVEGIRAQIDKACSGRILPELNAIWLYTATCPDFWQIAATDYPVLHIHNIEEKLAEINNIS